MSKAFSSEQLESLNSQSKTGRFVEAVIFTRDQAVPSVTDKFVKNGKPISFDGAIYAPIDMNWSGLKTNTSLELPNVQVTVPNVNNELLDYIEDNNIDIDGNDVILQILFIDKFNKITLVEEMLFQAEFMVADYHTAATFHLGVNYSLNDQIPRFTLETNEYPAIKGDIIRVGT